MSDVPRMKGALNGRGSLEEPAFFRGGSHMQRMIQGALRLMAGLVFAVAVGCGQAPEQDASAGSARMMGVVPQALSASVSSLTVDVSGPGMATLSFPLTKQSDGTWGGLLSPLPSGEGRTFTAVAYDVYGYVVAQGSAAAVTITPGQTALVALTMAMSGGQSFQDTVPIIDSVWGSSTTVNPGDTILFQASAHDVDPGEYLTYEWTASAGTFSGFSNYYYTYWTAPASGGPVTLTLKVTDSKGVAATFEMTIDVQGDDAGSAQVSVSFNTLPWVENMTISRSRVAVGESTELTAVAQDADGDAATLAWTWSASCAGSFETMAPGQARFTPSERPVGGELACGYCTITAQATDARGGTSEGKMTFCVDGDSTAQAPEITATIPSGNQLSTYSYQINNLEVSATDPQGSPLTFSWYTSSGYIYGQVDGPNTSRFTWEAPYCTWTYYPTVTVTVTNALGLSTSWTWNVSGVPYC